MYVHAVALSDRDGTQPLRLPPSEPPDGWGWGVATLEDRPEWVDVAVPTVTLDSFLDRAGYSEVALAKLDLEGHEAAALRGARVSLESGRLESLLIEINDARVVDRLRPYRFEEIIDVRNGFRRLTGVDEIDGSHTDVLCLRGRCVDRWRRLSWRARLA